jgi:hypothetical protein
MAGRNLQAIVEHPYPDHEWHVAAVKTPGAVIPVASCGSADRAEIIRQGLALLLDQQGEALVQRLRNEHGVRVPGDPSLR